MDERETQNSQEEGTGTEVTLDRREIVSDRRQDGERRQAIEDRRKGPDPNYTGPERRTGEDRREGECDLEHQNPMIITSALTNRYINN
jgi:hypothetical protein